MSVLPWSSPPAISAVAISYADLMTFHENAIALDSMSLRGRRAWTDQLDELDNANLDPSPLCTASLLFRTGLTTLTVVTKTANGSGHTLRIFFDGSQVATATLSNTTQTHTVTLTGRGWADRSIHEVAIDVDRSSGNAGDYQVLDAYVSPVSAIVTTSWPGLPTFGDPTVARGQQLAAAQQWLMDRMHAVAMPVPQGILYRTLHDWVSTPPRMFWRGGVARSNGANQLTAVVGYQSFNTPSERMRVLINGSEVATTATITAGQQGVHTFNVDLSGYGNETLLEVMLQQVVITPWPGGLGSLPTRWNLRWVETTQSARTYTVPTAYSQARESLTYGTLKARLNSIVSCLSQVYTRVTSNPDTWDRARLFRQMPVYDDYGREYYQRQLVARSRRFTDGLWVRGKGVTLHYGALAARPGKGEDPFYDWETTFKADLINGEAVQDVFLGFDTLPGLVGGVPYYLTGDVRYAAEVWRHE